ncbi:MAG TPA: TonB-dependent receptor plug domain-containing protein, partial [Segetibacter sp.]
MRRFLFTICCTLLASFQLFAQNRTITGGVTDNQAQPLANVSVFLKGTTIGTVTGNNGNYTISVTGNKPVLVFSFVNKETQEVSVGSSGIINVELKNLANEMDDVVVVGYTTERKKDVAGAISKIKGDEIANLPIPTFAQAMQGRAAGVAVAATSGIPGGAINVTIRGVGSLTAGNTPLYVVDGIQINTSLSGSIGGSSATGSSDAVKTQNNPLAFLNPGDIESIEILKDAASAAIYGAKAGSGVVLVTTKKGAAGKTKFTAHLSYGTLEGTKLQRPLTTQEWLQNRTEGIVNTSGFVITPDSARKIALGEIGRPGTLSDKDVSELNSTDW